MKTWERFRGSPLHGNIVLNFTSYATNDLPVYANAYWKAADTLVRAIKEANAYSDADACPIAFLYRHAIELYLKAIILWGADLVWLQSGEDIDVGKLFSTHRFTDLLPSVKRIFKEAGWLDEGQDEIDGAGEKFERFEAIEELILTFEAIDPKSFAFRYPVDTKGEAHLPKHFHFNIIALGEEVSEMLTFLDGAATGIDEMVQTFASMH